MIFRLNFYVWFENIKKKLTFNKPISFQTEFLFILPRYIHQLFCHPCP